MTVRIITTGTVALLFKPHAIPSVKAATSIKNFRAFSCGSWLKKSISWHELEKLLGNGYGIFLADSC
jgi:hypothetical protein